MNAHSSSSFPESNGLLIWLVFSFEYFDFIITLYVMKNLRDAETSRNELNAKQRYQEGPDLRRKTRTMEQDYVWHPSGLKDCFFHSNYNQWKHYSQETDIYVNIGDWLAEINMDPLPLVRFFLPIELPSVSQAFMSWKWIYSEVDVLEVFSR